jgi:hypothetical protein
MPEHESASSVDPSDQAQLPPKEPTALGPTSFRRISPTGFAETFTNWVLGSNVPVPKKIPWPSIIAWLLPTGLTVSLALEWVRQHGTQVFLPAAIFAWASFLALRDGSLKRESRLLEEVEGHVRGEVRKARGRLVGSLRQRAREERTEWAENIQQAWAQENPLGRLVVPWVTHCSLAGSVVHAHTVVTNLYVLPVILRCVGCRIVFTKSDNIYADTSKIAVVRAGEWVADIPENCAMRNVPPADPASLTQDQLAAVEASRKDGTLAIVVEAEYVVSAGVESGGKEFTNALRFRTYLL